MEMQLLLADEADLVLIGAQAVLKDRPDWTVIHTARSGGELLEAARRWQPDIILFNCQHRHEVSTNRRDKMSLQRRTAGPQLPV